MLDIEVQSQILNINAHPPKIVSLERIIVDTAEWEDDVYNFSL